MSAQAAGAIGLSVAALCFPVVIALMGWAIQHRPRAVTPIMFTVVGGAGLVGGLIYGLLAGHSPGFALATGVGYGSAGLLLAGACWLRVKFDDWIWSSRAEAAGEEAAGPGDAG